MSTEVRDLLAALGAIDDDAVEPYFPRVRDRDDIAVLRCRRSGVIFLDRASHAELAYYEKRERNAGNQTHAQLDSNQQVAVVAGDKTVVAPKLDDALRRQMDFGTYIHGRRWLDVGTGWGRILDLLGPGTSLAAAVEPNQPLREAASARGHTVYRTLDDVPDDAKFDVVTMFHVLEHLTDPVGTLQRIATLLSDGGQLIVEVPHARDFLLTTMDCEAFRAFTLWSEHLVLHTRESLLILLRAGGFGTNEIVGYQRYPLANHLHWLRHGKPGGHEKWRFLDNQDLHASYTTMLQSLDQTDSLVAYARR